MAPSTAKPSRKSKASARAWRARKAASSFLALPFLMFGLSVAAAVLSHTRLAHNEAVFLAFRGLLACAMFAAGAAHFHAPLFPFYASMVPVPLGAVWIYGSGAGMMAAAAALATDRWRQEGAAAIVALLVAVFPANVFCVFLKKPRDVVCGGSVKVALARLPFQVTLILWAQWMHFGY